MAILKKIFIILLGSVVSSFFFFYALENSPELQRRLMASIEQGDTGRNQLWLGALDAIYNNFFFGVGFTGVLTEMKRYSGIYNGPHNVFLYVLLCSGIVGFGFFMKFLWNIVRDQFLTYRITGKTIYLVILVIMIFNMSKAGGAIGKILFWFLFAILIAASTATINMKKSKITHSS